MIPWKTLWSSRPWMAQGSYTPVYPHTHAVPSTNLYSTTIYLRLSPHGVPSPGLLSSSVQASSWLTALLLVCTGLHAAHFSNRPEVVKVESENQNPVDVLWGDRFKSVEQRNDLYSRKACLEKDLCTGISRNDLVRVLFATIQGIFDE